MINRGMQNAERRTGVVLIAVLIVITLLALAAYQYAELMTAELKATDSAMRAAQARALAASGVHYTAAMLADRDSFTSRLGSNPYDNSGAFQGIEVGYSDNARYRGRFSIVSPFSADETSNGATGFRYGATDETSKLNINALMQIDPSGQVLYNALLKLPNMTEDVADAIVDWVDPDDESRANGAESQSYSGMTPGYRCKNGPLDSIEELLLVRGVTADLLFGCDINRNGVTDPGETAEGQPDDRGWSVYLTVYTRERNIDSEFQPRTYLNDTDINKVSEALTNAVGPELADFILAYRLYGAYSGDSGGGGGGGGSGGAGGGGGGGNQNIVTFSGGPINKNQLDMNRSPQSIASIFALVNARVGVSTQSTQMTQSVMIGPGGATIINMQQSTVTVTTVYTSPLSDPGKLRQMLPILLDKFTTRRDAEIPARINVNTAPAAVLATLPGLEETDVQNITSKRPNIADGESVDPIFLTPAWLLSEANLTPAKLQAIERFVAARSQVFRVNSLGYFERGGPVARIEAVIDTNGGQPRIVYWRDLSELGKGFEIPR